MELSFKHKEKILSLLLQLESMMFLVGCYYFVLSVYNYFSTHNYPSFNVVNIFISFAAVLVLGRWQNQLKVKWGTKGCLYGKTLEMKHDFLKGLADFATSDPVFFEEQYDDLLPNEKIEFRNWIRNEKPEIKNVLEFLESMEKTEPA